MDRRTFLLTAAGAALAQPQRPRNVVLIVADDLGWADLACYGSRYHETPRLDRLAAEGVRFTQAYAASPVCSPSRATIMTGRHNARLGITNFGGARHRWPYSRLISAPNRDELPLAEVTIAERLKTQGYRTGHIGKWHLGKGEFLPTNQGFDVNVGGTDSGSPSSFFYPQWGKNPPVSGQPGDYLTDRLTDEAVAFLRENRDRPFFLYLPHYAVHIPLEAKQALVEKYKQKQPSGGQANPLYAAMLESLDQGVGRVIDTLRELNLADNTLVLFTSDNGGLHVPEWRNQIATSNAPLRAGKGYLYEGGLRVPLIAWGAGIRGGRTATAVADHCDFVPTLLDYCGAPPMPNPDGTSLLGLLSGSSVPPERTQYWHYPHYSNQGGRPGSALRRGRYKLIEHFEDGRVELFDLQEDLSEQRDLAGQLPQVVKELRADLRRWRAEVNAGMPTVNGQYDPERATATTTAGGH